MSSSSSSSSSKKKQAQNSASSSEGFASFQKLCSKIAAESSRTQKSAIIRSFVDEFKQTTHNGNKGLVVLVRLLLPKCDHRTYGLKDNKLFKLFGSVFGTSAQDMLSTYQEDDTVAGDISLVLRQYFDDSQRCKQQYSGFALYEIDKVLRDLAEASKQEQFLKVLGAFCDRATLGDLQWLVRLIKKDLFINAGPQAVLDGVDPAAYAAFKINSSLAGVISQLGSADGVQVGSITVLNPIKPMLAKACKSFEMAVSAKECPSGVMFGEIKYDGERIQIHYDGSDFKYFARSLKPVKADKVSHIKDFLPDCCPSGNSFILDAEILLVDTVTGVPLPFGTLGKHKKNQLPNSSVCLFIFDLLSFNGKSLLDTPLQDRRKMMKKHFQEVEHKLTLSEMTLCQTEADVKELMDDCMEQGLEGLVLKDSLSVYGPGKRHWLKMKRDYLSGGSMADSADLIVLGAYFGTGKHGGQYATFLMGVLDKPAKKFRTVCKVHSGLDDAQIQNYTDTLDMTKISRNYAKIPSWLDVHATHKVPDLVINDPKKAPVWEVTGAEFTESKHTTALDKTGKGICIRFPRVSRIRNDKTWKTATNLEELQHLVQTSSGINKGGGVPKNTKTKAKAVESKKRKAARDEFVAGFDDDSDSDMNQPQSRQPARKKRKKTVCKYGASCYRTNKDHLDQFSHPHRDDPDEIVADDDGGGVDSDLDDFTDIQTDDVVEAKPKHKHKHKPQPKPEPKPQPVDDPEPEAELTQAHKDALEVEARATKKAAAIRSLAEQQAKTEAALAIDEIQEKQHRAIQDAIKVEQLAIEEAKQARLKAFQLQSKEQVAVSVNHDVVQSDSDGELTDEYNA